MPSSPSLYTFIVNRCFTAILFFVILLSSFPITLLAQDKPKPNIILMMCDDLGWGDVGFNGNRIVKTPHLDRLASSGIIFERFYSASAVCSPTRASCLTGRNPFRMNIPTANSGAMPSEEITLAELLKEEGYRTGFFGKWHLGTLTTKEKDANRARPGRKDVYQIPSNHGFDTYFATESKVPTFDPMYYPASFDTTNGENLRFGWAKIDDFTSAHRYGTAYWKGEEQKVTENLRGDNSQIIMDRALPFIDQSIEEQTPFFTVIWFHTPHLPVVADEAHRNMYPDLSHREQIYYGTITAMDEQVGRLWNRLEAMGVAENTLLCFASDNGPERNTPGSAGPFRDRKRALYEGGLRVPAFWIWPNGIKKGKQTKVAAVTSDYLPTILGVLSKTYPEKRYLDGMDLRRVIKGKQKKRKRPIGFLIHDKLSWVTDQYKLISLDKGTSYEMYDLMKDPSEQEDIISKFPEKASAMRTSLMEWKASVEESALGLDYK